MTMTDWGFNRMADRSRLARELHDGIAQDLVGVGYSLDLLLANPDTSIESRAQLRSLRFIVADLVDKVRREIYFLRQPSSLTLGQAIGSAAEELCKDHEVNLTIDENSPVNDSERSYEIYQISREILRNIVSHAQASAVSVSFRSSLETIEMCIADNGVGGAGTFESHYGLLSIQERANALQGSVEITSDSNGTRVCLQVPNENHATR
jgi:NarL family two-component system sensor histidine kinase LiaS